MLIRCLIDRDGVTTVQHNGVRIDFIPNEHGHYVAEVASKAMENYLFGMYNGTLFEEYTEPVQPPNKEVDAERPGFPQTKAEIAKQIYAEIDSKDKLEEQCLEEFGVNLSKRFSLENMKKQVFELIDKEYS